MTTFSVGHLCLVTLLILSLICPFTWSLVIQEKEVSGSSELETRIFDHRTGEFGPKAGSYNVTGRLVIVNPVDGCNQKKNLKGQIALIRRGECPFTHKVLEAQRMGAIGVVVGDNAKKSEWIDMANKEENETVIIPSVFVLSSTYNWLSGHIDTQKYLIATLNSTGEHKMPSTLDGMYIIGYLLLIIPSAWCLVSIFILARRVFKSCWGRLRRRQRLSHIPIISYIENGNDIEKNLEETIQQPHNDSCAICLDDFEDGTKIKLLPCSHGFHSNCIDPWLRASSELCPMCKQSIFDNTRNKDVELHPQVNSRCWSTTFWTNSRCSCCFRNHPHHSLLRTHYQIDDEIQGPSNLIVSI